MSVHFNLDILPSHQRDLWFHLNTTPSHFVLYGGTALALRLGHRQSVDFDFFSKMAFDPNRLFQSIPYLTGQQAMNVSKNTLDTKVMVEQSPVKLSFFGGLDLGQVNPPDIAADNGIAVASLEDIFGMKCATIIKRVETKDYIDIHSILTTGQLNLKTGLAAAQTIYGNQYHPLNTLKALTWFKDLPDDLPREIQSDLISAVEQIDLEKIPQIASTQSIGDICPVENKNGRKQ